MKGWDLGDYLWSKQIRSLDSNLDNWLFICRVVYEVDQVTVRFDPPVAGISNDSTCSVIIFQSQAGDWAVSGLH